MGAPFGPRILASDCRARDTPNGNCRNEKSSVPRTAEKKMEFPECGPNGNGLQKRGVRCALIPAPIPGDVQAFEAPFRNPESLAPQQAWSAPGRPCFLHTARLPCPQWA